MTFDQFAKKKISLSALLFGVALIILLTQLLRLLPGQFYFTFSGSVLGTERINYSALAYGTTGASEEEQEKQPTSFLSVVFKIAIPAVAGVILGFVWEEDGIDVAAVTGFAGAFILAWPAIMLWEILAVPEVVLKRNAFLILYILYGMTYSYICRLGSYAGVQLRVRYGASAGTGVMSLDWKNIMSTVAGGAISSGLALTWHYLL